MNHVGCSYVQVECRASAPAQAKVVRDFTWLTARLSVPVLQDAAAPAQEASAVFCVVVGRLCDLSLQTLTWNDPALPLSICKIDVTASSGRDTASV